MVLKRKFTGKNEMPVKKSRKVKSGSSKFYKSFDTGPERKFKDLWLANDSTRALGIVSPVNVIGQGTDFNQRIGRQITMKTIHVKVSVAAAAASLASGAFTNNTDVVRIALVYDKQTNQNAPQLDDIWQVGTSYLQAPCTPRNLDNYDRFNVLMDERVSLCSGGPNGAFVERYMNVNLPVRYDGTGGTVSDIVTGGLFFVTCDQNDTTTNYIRVSGNVRVTFTDM